MSAADGLQLSVEARRWLAEQAIKHGHKLKLPIVARSRSPDEIRRRERSIGAAVLVVYAVLASLLLWAGASEGGPDGQAVLIIGIPLALLGTLAVPLAIRLRGRRLRGYRDPRLVIEVTEASVRVTGPNGTSAILWAWVEAEPLGRWAGDRLQFAGVMLQSPFGAIPIEEDWFKHGWRAAAAIVATRAQRHATRLRD